MYSETISDLSNPIVGSLIMGVYGSYFSGSISMCRIFNYALTPTQIANYSRPEYPIEWVDRGATGAETITNAADRDFSSDTGFWTLSSATISGGKLNINSASTVNAAIHNGSSNLTTNKKYRVKYDLAVTSGNGINFNIGGNAATPASIVNGTNVFDITIDVAVGYYISTYYNFVGTIDNISTVQLGCVLDLNAEGINRQNISTVSASYWWDATNNIKATVSGASVMIPSASNLGGMSLNGTSSRLLFTVPDPDNYNSGYSVSLWCRPLAIPNSFLFQIQDNGGSWGGIEIGIYGRYFTYRFGNGSSGGAHTSTQLAVINTDYNIIITHSYTVDKIYINGVLIGTHTGGTLVNSSTTLRLGTIYSEDGYWYNGNLSNVNIWGRCLYQDDVTLINALGH